MSELPKETNGKTVGLVIAASAAVGVLVGVLWSVLAPRPELVIRSGRAVDLVSYPESYAAADLLLGLLGILAGLILSLVFLTAVYPSRPDATLLGLLVGGIAGAVIAARFGELLGSGDLAPLTEGQAFLGDLRLSAPGVLLLWPLAVAAVGLVIGLRRRRVNRLASAEEFSPPAPAELSGPEAG